MKSINPLTKINIRPLNSPRSGNPVPNQLVIEIDTKNGYKRIFQSYGRNIAMRHNGKVYLDETYWNWSRTTSKYRNEFLRECTDETWRKLQDGTYKYANLN